MSINVMRAKVTETNIDSNEYGAVRIFIPEIMCNTGDPDYNEDEMGIIAYPANNPIGGMNDKDADGDSNFQGCAYVPQKGSWMWIFFEGSNLNRPYYFAALNIENAKLPPECTSAKVVVIYKSHEGRAIVISDDTINARTELTGKKRNLSEPPSGDVSSVLEIEGNQNVIVINEADGADQILIATHKGDYINLDVNTGNLSIYFRKNINIEAGGNISIKAGGDFNVKAVGNANIQGIKNANLKGGANAAVEGGAQTSIKGASMVAIDGAQTITQSGASQPADPAVVDKPEGGRG